MPISATALGSVSASGFIGSNANVTLLQGVVQKTAAAAYADNIPCPLPFATGSPLTFVEDTPFCLQVTAVLAAAGWTLQSQVAATGSLFAPLGWDFGSFLSLAGVVQGLAFQFYDPTRGGPPSGYDGPYPIVGVPVAPGQDPEAQLAVYITSYTEFFASILDANNIILTAKVPGFVYNGVIVQGSGSTTIGSGWTSGGGEIWTTTGAHGNSASMSLLVSTGPVYQATAPQFIGPAVPGNGRAYMEFTVNGGDRLAWTLAHGTWFAHASKYSFYVHCHNPSAIGDTSSGNSHFWGCLPMIPKSGWTPLDSPPNGIALTTAVFLSYFAGLTLAPMAGGAARIYAPAKLDLASTDRGWAMIGFHNENQHAYPITDQKYGDLIQTALVAMKQSGTQERICGYVGDAFVINRSVALLSEMQKDGLIYVALARQDRPIGALYQLLGNAVASVDTSAPAGQQISPSNPFYGSRVVLGSASLDWQETASILTIASGTSPDQSWVGKYILYPGSGAGDASGLALQFSNGGQAGTLHRVTSILGTNQVLISGWYTPNNANQLAQYKALYSDTTQLPFAIGPF